MHIFSVVFSRRFEDFLQICDSGCAHAICTCARLWPCKLEIAYLQICRHANLQICNLGDHHGQCKERSRAFANIHFRGREALANLQRCRFVILQGHKFADWQICTTSSCAKFGRAGWYENVRVRQAGVLGCCLVLWWMRIPLACSWSQLFRRPCNRVVLHLQLQYWVCPLVVIPSGCKLGAIC